MLLLTNAENELPRPLEVNISIMASVSPTMETFYFLLSTFGNPQMFIQTIPHIFPNKETFRG